MKIRLINRWRDAWRFGSVRLALLLAAVAGLEQHLPTLAGYLPEGWAAYLALAIVVARVLLVQMGKPEPDKAGGTA